MFVGLLGFLKFLPFRGQSNKSIKVTNLNSSYYWMSVDVLAAMGYDVSRLPPRRFFDKKIFVIDFDGDAMANQSSALSQEVTAILCAALPDRDEVLVRVTSAGGVVHGYGYAASQIERFRSAGLYTTVAVDKIAASGGYMMACVADKIISAPFAIVGSIGVVAEFPNFNKLMTNLGVDYKQYTAGEFKRTISSMAPITPEGETKFVSDLKDTHNLFKNHVSRYRPNMNIDTIATGEHWYGTQALENGLVDEIKTSDQWIIEKTGNAEVLKISYIPTRSWSDRFKVGATAIFEGLVVKALTIFSQVRLS